MLFVKIGDLVKLSNTDKTGVVIDVVQKKCWRTSEKGVSVDWSKVDPEPHAVVLFNNKTMSVPFTNLEVVDEAS